MDRAIWATWYDLPDTGRERYLAWLHNSYIPHVTAQLGLLWAAHYESVPHHLPPGRVRHVDDPAVPTGNGFILLFGAEDAHAFARPVPSKLHASLPAGDREMLAMRVGERVHILTEEARVDGPEVERRESRWALSPCIQIGTFNAASFHEEEGLLDWYARNRMAAMKDLPGCLGVRKYVSVCGWAKHGVLYEFTSLAARNAHFPNHADSKPQLKSWSDKLVPSLIHAPGSPNVARRLWPAARAT
jgi:hypothetical protein